MRRILVILAACSFALPLYVGCDREASTTQTETVSTPEGETTTTRETTVESSGDNPPAVDGQRVPPSNPNP